MQDKIEMLKNKISKHPFLSRCSIEIDERYRYIHLRPYSSNIIINVCITKYNGHEYAYYMNYILLETDYGFSTSYVYESDNMINEMFDDVVKRLANSIENRKILLEKLKYSMNELNGEEL